METVARALKLLKLIAEKPLRVQEVADALGIHKSSASRLLSTLHEEQFLRLNSEKKYELGYTIFDLAHIMKENLNLRKVARPYLETLGNATHETMSVSISATIK